MPNPYFRVPGVECSFETRDTGIVAARSTFITRRMRLSFIQSAYPRFVGTFFDHLIHMLPGYRIYEFRTDFLQGDEDEIPFMQFRMRNCKTGSRNLFFAVEQDIDINTTR